MSSLVRTIMSDKIMTEQNTAEEHVVDVAWMLHFRIELLVQVFAVFIAVIHRDILVVLCHILCKISAMTVKTSGKTFIAPLRQDIEDGIRFGSMGKEHFVE